MGQKLQQAGARPSGNLTSERDANWRRSAVGESFDTLNVGRTLTSLRLRDVLLPPASGTNTSAIDNVQR